MQAGGETIPGVFEAPENPLGVGNGTEETNTESEADGKDLAGLTTREITELALIEEREKAQSSGGDSEQGRKEQAKEPEKAGQVAKPQQRGQAQDTPPNRLSESDKQIFNSLPPQLKAATARMFRDLENQSRRHWSEMTTATQEAKSVTGNVERYLLHNPNLVESGYTPATFVNALLGVHIALGDEKAKWGKATEILQQIGTDDKNFMRIGQALGFGHLFGGSGTGTNGASHEDISTHPHVVALQERVDQLQRLVDPVLSDYQQSAQRARDTEIQQKTQEGYSLLEEKDAAGRLRYPELSDPGFRDQVKPLVVGLGKTLPDVSFGDRLRIVWHMQARGLALMSAIAAAEADKAGNSNQSSPPRLPVNNSNNLERATRAAVSVRGRTTPGAAMNAGGDDQPPPEVMAKGIRAITEWQLNRLKSGVV